MADEHEASQGVSLVVPYRFSLNEISTSRGARLRGARIERGALVAATPAQDAVEQGILGARAGGVRVGGLRIFDDGSSIEIQARIARAVPDTLRTDVDGRPIPDDLDTWLYEVKLEDPSLVSGWGALCERGENLAIPMEGVWDLGTGQHMDMPDMFSFACLEDVAAKCYRSWSYRPWDLARSPDMRELHQACTRMARADYCGNGITATEEATLVDAWDSEGVTLKAPDRTGYTFEAAWTGAGALCMDHFRWPNLIEMRSCLQRIPACHSPAEAQRLAGPGAVLVFNKSFKFAASRP